MGKIKMVRQEGGSRVISVTDVIPIKWVAVETEVVKSTDEVITVKINKVR